ncbi:MAG: hypothetical protein B7Y40_08090 [Gammaproteobacteria bacterium 28-57-27]|nr:MAG: hypothetical protein B7Y40_08090 [Gammaproteobacteria bacterium 28-57-27]
MHDTAQEAVREVRAYHHASKHHLHGYAPGPAFLDWDTQPDPFRRYHDAPLFPLPLVTGHGACRVDALYSAAARTPQALNAHSLGLFLELALGLSAWKSNGVERWALRNNPSSGNLHPTEGYLLLWRAISPELVPGLYHYAPHEHALERRARLPDALAGQLSSTHAGCFGALGLSSVIWREAWKYGARAYRYCQLDVGHALAAARLAARVQGWTLRTETALDDATLSACLGVDRAEDYMTDDMAEAREHADLLAVLGTATPQAAIDWSSIARALDEWTGTANRLSQELVEWPQITRLLPALHKPAHAPMPHVFPPAETDFSSNQPSTNKDTDEPMDACALIRQRRSAQRMDGQSGITRRAFERMLHRTLPHAGCAPFDALPAPPAIQLLLFVHAVEGLQPGIYALIRAADTFDALRRACSSDALAWQPVTDTALPLYRLYAPLELRKPAAQLSCQQGIAGRGAFSLGMLADLGGALEKEGAWVYRRLFWEAGMIGQVLYLEAESAGMQGTGIGCFFDDEVHRLLGLEAEGDWQDLYHFTVGKGLNDTRLASEPAYAHLPASRLT